MKTCKQKKYEPLKVKRVEASTIVKPHDKKNKDNKNRKEVPATKLKNNWQPQKVTMSTRNHAAKTKAVTKPVAD